MICCNWNLPKNDDFLNKYSGQFWYIIGNLVPAAMQVAAAKSLSMLEWSLFTNWRLWTVLPMSAAKRGHSVHEESKMSKYRPITDTFFVPLKTPLYLPFLQNVSICPCVPLSCWGPESTLAFVVFLVLERNLNLLWTARRPFNYFCLVL